ncbi:MAG: Hpt domain-containing protein [Desulfobacterales bacterium]|nr:Hpt domain-containing protein [Desulfobacterales bacterium]
MDIEKLAAQLDMNKEEYTVLLRLFIQTSVTELSDLKDAIKAGNHEKAKHLLHSFKGASVNLGFTEFADQSLYLQNLVYLNPDQVPDLIRKLIRQIRDLENLLTASR